MHVVKLAPTAANHSNRMGLCMYSRGSTRIKFAQQPTIQFEFVRNTFHFVSSKRGFCRLVLIQFGVGSQHDIETRMPNKKHAHRWQSIRKWQNLNTVFSGHCKILHIHSHIGNKCFNEDNYSGNAKKAMYSIGQNVQIIGKSVKFWWISLKIDSINISKGNQYRTDRFCKCCNVKLFFFLLFFSFCFSFALVRATSTITVQIQNNNVPI